MPNLKLIEAKTLGSNTASVTFSSIPQTYTDLKLVISSRTSFATTSSLLFQPNGSTSNLTAKRIYGTGTTVLSDTGTNALQNGQDTTSNTFTNIEVYFPNYTSSNYKSFSLDGVMENNATFAYAYMLAYLWSDTAAISSLTLAADGNFVSGSTFYLYGISNVTTGSKATGGIVSYDATYYYHTFPYSGTFTPTQSLTADYLVVAGGGGSGSDSASGGGAGGFRSSLSGGSALSLTAQAYTVTVGAGGNGGVAGGADGSVGSNSVFSTITSSGGGGGGFNNNGSAGGSGGGGGDNATGKVGGAGNAGSYSPVEGYAGGNGYFSASPFARGGAGGGGAGAVGNNGSSGGGGNGGIGVQLTAFANATQTGVNGYYAGGGGGSAYDNTKQPGIGGLGGGGTASVVFGTAGINGMDNTGGGGACGGGSGSTTGGNGGSGIVIIRYAI
jgi:hypothetical protein